MSFLLGSLIGQSNADMSSIAKAISIKIPVKQMFPEYDGRKHGKFDYVAFLEDVLNNPLLQSIAFIWFIDWFDDREVTQSVSKKLLNPPQETIDKLLKDGWKEIEREELTSYPRTVEEIAMANTYPRITFQKVITANAFLLGQPVNTPKPIKTLLNLSEATLSLMYSLSILMLAGADFFSDGLEQFVDGFDLGIDFSSPEAGAETILRANPITNALKFLKGALL